MPARWLALGTAGEPAPAPASTGAVGEDREGELVRIAGTIVGSPTTLTSGLAFDVDDGTGATRVVVGTATGIDTAAWLSGSGIDVVGVAGQRDSTGTGTDGYRVLPRDAGDVIGLTPAAGSPSPSPSSGGPSPSPSPSPGLDGVTLDRRGARRPRRTPSCGSAASSRCRPASWTTARPSCRTGPERSCCGSARMPAGSALGARVEVEGKRSTLSGMESLRVSEPPTPLGTAAEPTAREIRTGDVGEAQEATLVVARGAIVASARRASSGTVSFEIDDGSGPLRVSLASRLRADRDPLVAGTWVEVRGVLGQETSRSKPTEGYRIWPRAATEVRVTAPATGGPGSGGGGSGGGPGGGAGGPAGSLGDIGAADLAQLRIGATLVVGRWKELGVGGLLWDGSRLVAVHASSEDLVRRLTRDRRPPLALDLGGLQAAGTDRTTGVPVVRLGSGAGQTVVLDATPAPPRSALAGALPAWVSVVGQLSGSGSRRVLVVDGERVALHERCGDDDDDDGDDDRDRSGTVSVTGVALGEPLRLLVPCGGMRSAPSIVGRRRAPGTRRRRRASPIAGGRDDRGGAGRGRSSGPRGGPPAGRRGRPRRRCRPRSAAAAGGRGARERGRRGRPRGARTSAHAREGVARRRSVSVSASVYSRAFIDRAHARRELPPR